MLTSLLPLLLLSAGQSSALAFDEAKHRCTTDSCLQAADANSGCAAFFRKTVIPATSTVRTTEFVPKTITKTTTSTDTSVTTDYASTASTTSTEVATTITITSTLTSTSVITETTTLPYSPEAGKAKRTRRNKPTTTSETDIPADASAACTNAAKFSSACSCFSVAHQTTTLATPLITKTLTRHPKTVTTTVEQASTTSISNDPGTLTVFTTETVTSTTTTTTSETTETTTTISTTSASPTCDNAGSQWAYYQKFQGGYFPPYPGYQPEGYKTRSPTAQGVEPGFGGFGNPNDNYYGSAISLGSENYVLNQRGYFYAAVAGAYTFTFNSVDDVLSLWLGDTAYSGWTRANAALEVQWDVNTYGPGHGSVTMHLDKGYTAYRIAFMQAYGGVGFRSAVSGPDGEVVLTSETRDPAQVVQFGCSEFDSAPAFPDFGEET